MKKIKINKNKYRSSSVLNWTNPSKFNKKIKQNNFFRNPSSTMNNNNKNQETFNALFKDLQIYKKQNQKIMYKLNLKDIDIIKAKENSDLLHKVSNFLEQKKEKVSLINRLKDPKTDNLKKLLHESKSEQNFLTKTFSTTFIGNDEYRTLSQAFGKGHSKKIGAGLKKNDNCDNSFSSQTKTDLFSKYNINPEMTVKEKEILKSINHKKKKKIGVSSKINFYTNQFDSFKSLQINKNLFNQLILKQEKEQIKQFLKNELQNEQQRLTLKLMPKIHTIELSKYKKDTQENNELNGIRPIVNSLSDLSKIPRATLFQEYNSVYLKNISKFLSTPTCRAGAKMISYLEEDSNNYKILLFGGQNVIKLDDLWECTIRSPSKLEKNIFGEKLI